MRRNTRNVNHFGLAILNFWTLKRTMLAFRGLKAEYYVMIYTPATLCGEISHCRKNAVDVIPIFEFVTIALKESSLTTIIICTERIAHFIFPFVVYTVLTLIA